ncbi:hypothetical protein VIBHAR_05774 [Vibrio campbellii ATCC BAA-1116]|uniref:Uncharacterized protein n=1 Tax=Vibrio campbellii (strain ATCC BAA-1116) TaxID=2902295 RepID=A7N520_VIBC1|nr:hypothetical protein VIBHAR_05774 [Vibrio campbellii ATCC BAA-1116]
MPLTKPWRNAPAKEIPRTIARTSPSKLPDIGGIEVYR